MTQLIIWMVGYYLEWVGMRYDVIDEFRVKKTKYIN